MGVQRLAKEIVIWRGAVGNIIRWGEKRKKERNSGKGFDGRKVVFCLFCFFPPCK